MVIVRKTGKAGKDLYHSLPLFCASLLHAADSAFCTNAPVSDGFTKFNDFVLSVRNSFFIFHRAQSQTPTALNFHMPIKMLDTFDNSVAFSHAWPGSQGNGEPFLSAADGCMRLVRVTPRRAAVNESFELSGNIRPIRGRYGNKNVCPFVLRNDFVHIILLNTFGCVMTGSAAFTKPKFVIINTYTSDLVSFFQAIGDDCCNFCCCTIFYRTAIHD